MQFQKKLQFLIFFLGLLSLSSNGQVISEILGRPTNNSITVSFLPDQPVEVFWEYGRSSGLYDQQSDTFLAVPDSAFNYVFQNLSINSRYYYRSRYRVSGSSGPFLAGEEHSFHTQRPVGSTFTFAVEADPHLDTNSVTSAYTLTLQNILEKNPDFLIDLGDNFMSEKLSDHDSAGVAARHLLYRPYFGSICHSVPLFLVLGNHEGEQGWMLNGTSSSMPVMTTLTRKRFYPNPVPDAFYSGNIHSEPYVGLRQNYYSWEWGNCLFIVIDPYWYTIQKPGWGWTLGIDQYNWLNDLLTNTTARFKFIFCHQLVAGNGNDGRGGVEFSGLFEMGGYNQDSTWGFDTYRPGWEKPVHQMMVDSKATIYFHGHDHCYAKQDRDGIIYQEVPQPSARNITNISGIQYGYEQGVLLPNRGFLLVTVNDTIVKVDYVRTFLPSEESGNHKNGDISYSYTLPSSGTGIGKNPHDASLFCLKPAMPNPFSNETLVKYTLAGPSQVHLELVDPLGKTVCVLADGYQQPGDHQVTINSSMHTISRGIYLCRLICGNQSQTIKISCVK